VDETRHARRAAGSLSLKGRALRHLARREHSRAELERKLLPHAADLPDATAAEQVRGAAETLAGATRWRRTACKVMPGWPNRCWPVPANA
jgi:regulatory protein